MIKYLLSSFLLIILLFVESSSAQAKRKVIPKKSKAVVAKKAESSSGYFLRFQVTDLSNFKNWENVLTASLRGIGLTANIGTIEYCGYDSKVDDEGYILTLGKAPLVQERGTFGEVFAGPYASKDKAIEDAKTRIREELRKLTIKYRNYGTETSEFYLKQFEQKYESDPHLWDIHGFTVFPEYVVSKGKPCTRKRKDGIKV